MKTLSEYKSIVNAEIEQQFSTLEVFTGEIDPLFTELVQTIKGYMSAGGKRFRPYLMYLAYKGAGGTNEDEIISVAAALELLHSFLLIHDDIIDNDYVRYGVQNVEGVYQQKFASLGTESAKRYASNVAILAGDITHVLSSQAIAKAELTPEVKALIFNVMLESTMKVAGGELVDVLVSTGLDDIEVTEERILRMYEHKTASYTFELPLRLGYLVAQQSEQYITEIKKLSTALGIAYQLTDDLIGVFGNSAETGKSNDGDIREGKRTILYCKALHMLPADQKARFLKLYGNPHATDEDISEVRALFETYNIKKETELLRDTYTKDAQSWLNAIVSSEPAQLAFQNMIATLQSRTA